MPARSRYMSLVVSERRALERERVGTPWGPGEDRTATGPGWVRGRAFSSFCRRPTAISQPAVLSEHVLALPQAYPQLTPHGIYFFCFSARF